MKPPPVLSTRFRTGLAALLIGVLAAGSVVASPVVALAAPVESGSLSWGVKSSFRSYITGPGGGTATVAEGAVDTGSGYDFTQSSGELNADDGTGAAVYAGSVRFLGHGGALDLTFASPTVRLTGPQTAVLNVTVDGTAVDLATIDLSQAARTDDPTGVTITAAPTRLTAAGVPAFANFYTAGTALDPVTFTIAVDAPVVEPSPEPTTEPTTEPTAEPTTEPTTEPTPEPTTEPTPEPTTEPAVPATPTVTVSKTTGLDAAGESVTVTGTGFLPAAAGETTGTRPPLAGKFTGVYVTFGTFLDTWQPSIGAAASTRKNSDVKWAVSAADQATIGGAAAGAIEVTPDGSFETSLTVTKDFAGALADGNYGIYTYPGGGAKYAPFEIFTPVTFAAVVEPPLIDPPVVTPPVVDPPVTTLPVGSLTWGITSSFLDYVTGPIARGTITVGGAAGETADGYTFPQSTDAFDESTRTGDAGYSGSIRFSGHDGALDLTFENPLIRMATATTGTLVLTVNGAAVDFATIDIPAASPGAAFRTTVLSSAATAGGVFTVTGAAVTLTEQGAAAFAGFYPAGTVLDPISFTVGSAATEPINPTEPPVVTPPVVTPPVITPPIVTGPVVTPAATVIPAGSLSWGVKSAFRSYVTGAIAQGGISVSGGATAADGAYRFGQSGGSLNTAGLGSASYAGVVRFTGHGGLLDLTFAQPTVRIDSATAATLLVTVNGSTVEFGAIDLAAATRSTPAGAVSYAAAPVTLTGAGAAAFAGYYAAGIALDPVSFTVGVAGAAPAGSTGTIALAALAATPAATPAVDTPAVAPAAGCLVSDATLAWGLKSSFRSYLTGGIANGDWALGTGTGYAAEQFGWTGGTGSYDAATAAGLLGFTGDVRFTGHDGALDTTLANPQIEVVDAGTGYLILDVTGTTQTGEVVNTPGVRFALLDLTAATENAATDARIEWAGVPATLTAAGAAAFGTYPEGEELDPVDLAFSVAAECGTVAVASGDAAADAAGASAADGDDITSAAASAGLAWLIWLVVAVLLLALLAAIVLRRRRRAVAAG